MDVKGYIVENEKEFSLVYTYKFSCIIVVNDS